MDTEEPAEHGRAVAGVLLGQTADSGARSRRASRPGSMAGCEEGQPGRSRNGWSGQAGILAAYARSSFEAFVDELVILDPPTSHRDGPHFLGVQRVVDIPDALGLLAPDTKLTLVGKTAKDKAFDRTAAIYKAAGVEDKFKPRVAVNLRGPLARERCSKRALRKIASPPLAHRSRSDADHDTGLAFFTFFPSSSLAGPSGTAMRPAISRVPALMPKHSEGTGMALTGGGRRAARTGVCQCGRRRVRVRCHQRPGRGTARPAGRAAAGRRPGRAVRPGVPPPAQPLPEPDRRVVGYLYGNVPITREELGDFLIARGGHEKLELLANKRIIEIEAARRGVTVTVTEISAGLEEDLRGLGLNIKDFEKHVLPRYNKTLYEWIEDVIKPRLLLTKMCKDRVNVTAEDIQKEFENRHGERREAKIICWSREDLKSAQAQWAEARKGDAEFDAVAKQQADPNLAAACGRVKPIGRHSEANDATVVKTLYTMKPGEISGLMEVSAGIMCIKYTAVVPPEAGKTLDEKMQSALRTELSATRLDREIPKCFQELKAAAKPNLLLKGPPSAAEFREGVNNIINQVPAAGGVTPAGGVPVPAHAAEVATRRGV